MGDSLILRTAGTTETQYNNTSMLYFFVGQRSQRQKTLRKLQLLWKMHHRHHHMSQLWHCSTEAHRCLYSNRSCIKTKVKKYCTQN